MEGSEIVTASWGDRSRKQPVFLDAAADACLHRRLIRHD